MHRAVADFVVFCLSSALLGILAAPVAQAQGNADADICASTNDAAYTPEQRIAACGTLIDTLKDQPKALAAALVDRGATYWFVNKIQLSLGDFDRAIALDPSNARAFRERSNACRSIGRLDQALADANQAVKLDPNDAKAFDNRGNVFNNSGQYDRAIADYGDALRLKPDDAQTYMDRGVAYHFKTGLSVGDQRLRSGDQARSEKIARLHQSRRRLQQARPQRPRHRRRGRSDPARSARSGIL